MKATWNWVYILHCDNNAYYTGYTNNLVDRYQAHITGRAKCKYTRSFKPLTIAQCWKIQGDKVFAMQLERHIKRMSRSEKEKIIARPSRLSEDPRVQIVSKRHRLQILNQSQSK